MNNRRRRAADYIHPDQVLIDSARNRKILSEIQGINNRIIRNNLHQKPNLKISYCTTCYNRFWQLSKILRSNFNQVKDDPDIEFVVVDFHGTDSQKIQDFILENFSNELQNGRLKYYRRKAGIKPFVWNVAIAKNVAHRLATGDVLVNLDGDNFIQPSDSRIIRYYFNQIPKLLFHQNWCNMALINMFRSLRIDPEKYDVQMWALLGTNRGTFGRISMIKKDFFSMGGYNEQMINMGNQDTDLLFRSLLSEFQYLVSSPRADGSPKASIVNASDIQNKQLKHNRELTQKAYKSKSYVVNKEGFKETLANYQLIQTNVNVEEIEIPQSLKVPENPETSDSIVNILENQKVENLKTEVTLKAENLKTEVTLKAENLKTESNLKAQAKPTSERNLKTQAKPTTERHLKAQAKPTTERNLKTVRKIQKRSHVCVHCGDIHSEVESEVESEIDSDSE